MGKSKGDKIVKKFYKGGSQDSNDGGEELEPLRPVDSQHQAKAGKVDSRYAHMMYDEDRTLSIPLTKEVALSVQDIMIVDDPSQTTSIGKLTLKALTTIAADDSLIFYVYRNFQRK